MHNRKIFKILCNYDSCVCTFLSRSRLHTSAIYTEIKGPFGYDQNYRTQSGPNPSASITMLGPDFPTGYPYQVCVHANGIVNSLINNNCQFSAHNAEGDESISMNVP